MSNCKYFNTFIVDQMIEQKLENIEKEREQILEKLEKEADELVNKVPEIINKNRGEKYIKISDNIKYREEFVKILTRKLKNNGFYPILFTDINSEMGNETEIETELYVYIVNLYNFPCNIL